MNVPPGQLASPVGFAVGRELEERVGVSVGVKVGIFVGALGIIVGVVVGRSERVCVGRNVEGMNVGFRVVGDVVGRFVGSTDGR